VIIRGADFRRGAGAGGRAGLCAAGWGMNEMGKTDFEEYLETTRQQAKEPDGEFRERELTEWKEYIGILYRKIADVWLKEYLAKGLVSIKYEDRKIYEEFAGEYEVKALVLTINRQNITFEPVGTMLLGAKGRIDVFGKNGKASFVLVDKNLTEPNIQVRIFRTKKEKEEDYEQQKKQSVSRKVEWEWKIFINNGQINYEELNEDSFFDVIMGLING